ncbi:patatin-like phospholipase family protein [Priestia abyssalis]|uniref:patatin-like phospholipase family protein n=1 Tax=Priestia abyssalis TaxID=1221450 RepID=UPI000994B9A8|nr:patatin-like phospholipase family protein [Priestia abyssalis]
MYIDGVFSGGGIKGFALIGALQAIEEKGFVFRRLAGTSAGAIISAFIMAGYTSRDIFEMMNELELEHLLDERRTILPAGLTKWLCLYWRLGLYKGEKLEKWVEVKLKDRGIYTFADLPPHSLRIVASDLTNGKILVLPDDLPNYGISPERFSVAKAVRMSCSLPYFFEPVKLKSLGETIVVVDGGVLSNFPIWLFDHETRPKVRPVLGVKLSPKEEEQEKNEIKNAIDLFGALFETMKDAHDARHISKRHEKNIIFLPVKQVVLTEFQLSDETKLELIRLGKEETYKFFKKWCY